MLSYFRKNDPFRVIGLIGLILVTRIYLFVVIGVESSSELIGINQLEDLFNNFEGPLYALFESAFSFLGNNAYLNVTLASLIILLNAALLNSILIRNSAFEENTFVPAASYIILLSFQKANFFISSELLGTSFILIALSYLFKHLRFRYSEENVISTGSTLAISSLFFLPFGWSLILGLILFLFYSGTTGRRYLLLVWGFVLILLICWVTMLFFDESKWFWTSYYEGLMSFEYDNLFIGNIAICLGLPFLISLKSSTFNLAGMGMTNIQITVKRVFTWIGFFGVVTLTLQSGNSQAPTIIIAISMSYFITEHLLEIRRKWLAELTLSGLLILALVMLYLFPFY